MRRSLVVSLVLLTACGEQQQSCDLGPWTPDDPPVTQDPHALAVATTGAGPGRITFVNSNPVPGSTLAGCGPTGGA